MNKQILKLAIPNIISNLAVPILGVVDTALVGHMEGLSHLGAIAIGGMIFNFIYWSFGFLRMGTTGLTAQAFGRKSKSDVIHILLRALIVALVSALFLIIAQQVILKISLLLVSTSPDIAKHASVYFKIRIYAAPATLGLYAFHGWFLGMQNARYPLYLTIIANVANLLLNLLFIKVYNMNSEGIALGTVIAQYLGLFSAIILFLYSYKSHLNKIIRSAIFEIDQIRKFFSVNGDIFIRTMTLIFSFSFFTAQSAKMGDDILAVNTILLQLWMVFSFGIDGFAFAAESIVGKYVGSGDKVKLKLTIRYIFLWGISLGALFSLSYFLFGNQILNIFTDKTQILALCLVYYPWTIVAPVINSFCYIWDGIYIGATATKAMRNTMLISTLLFFLPMFYIGMALFENHGIWLAMLLFMIARWISLQLVSKKHIYNE
ncbi:MAG: MATE family efflux transporter [Calditrichaeota bacterium]|nr:MAG: MATE family efflux transporter [Calditrichota bacterium]MBL1204589.1 MATE family efflux transporter [Calditrichota bacterium]NOG44418.1 MATE family efflux transporter [Calditrichota bacterium]